ncbi:SGNH hydrolase-type esterase domain-containing protein [Pelagophyceae sp. CCMP2097]|nr:SGNH hydrolase-type esterase domain-containing protein [Pelagophyceae sp. CCMP2097]|mmetsp:Transcript_19092/g.67895  ORF Transcript_19092/g.67895 Transcript_19092/m.67895 type:complete len:271 (+) Transcript_19092:72-884(+)
MLGPLSALWGASRSAELPWATERPCIVLLGDSITQFGFQDDGWASRLAAYFQRRADVLNRGCSGYNTRWALEAGEAFFDCKGRNVALAVIWFGANDAAMPGSRQHVPLNEFETSVHVLVNAALRMGARRVIVMGTPPVADAKFAAFCKTRGRPLDRSCDAAKKYADAAQRAAAAAGVLYCDIFEAFTATEDWHSLLSDGLHLTPEGQRCAYEALHSIIDGQSDLAVEPCKFTGSLGNSGSHSALKHHLPWHDALDEKYKETMAPCSSDWF